MLRNLALIAGLVSLLPAHAELIPLDKPKAMRLLKAPFTGILQSTMGSGMVRKGEQMVIFRRAKRIAR